MAQRKNLDDICVVKLLDDWNVDVPSWKYPRNLKSPRVSSPGFGNNSNMMVMLVDLSDVFHLPQLTVACDYSGVESMHCGHHNSGLV
ncbi:uncharacterized protein TNCV_80361 [Trichonephila clavipes]|nr:uncharacterized protein TNCV_80361 [Trichonephila clavipes]